MLLVLAVAGWSLDTLVDDRLTAYFDTTLNAKARSIVALTEQDEDGVELEIYADALPAFSQNVDPDYFHVINKSRETLFISPSADGLQERLPAFQGIDSETLFSVLDSLDEPDKTKLRYVDHDLPDGRSGRWVVISYYPRIDPDDDESIEPQNISLLKNLSEIVDSNGIRSPILVNGELITPERVLTYVGTSRIALDRLMWTIDMILLLASVAIAAAIVIIASLGIRRAIAPLSQLAADIAAVDERSLDSRVALSKPVAELEVLVDHFNKLLERLKTAFNRERQFSADVAHELRTPIAEMRTLIEVHARFPKDKILADAFSDDLLGSTERVQQLVEQLLALSRAEHGAINIGDPVDLVPLLQRQTQVYEKRALERGMNFNLECSCSELFVAGSQVWPMILVNVLDNAIEHAYGEGAITVVLEASLGFFSFSISNPCKDLNNKDVDSVFDRLWTKDAARTESTHSGLGLALVNAYARLLELECEATLSPPTKENREQTLFTLRLKGSCSETQ